MARPSRRAELLDAAVAVIRERGAQALTLDAVAARAGVSKGGLLYHFATKQALVDDLVERWLDDFERRLTGDDLAVAYVEGSDLHDAGPELSASEFGMLAALIEEPRSLEAVRERHERWMERLLDGAADPAAVWLARLAADGLWYADLLGIAPPRGEERRAVLARLLALARGEAR